MMLLLNSLFVILLCLTWGPYVSGRCCSSPPTTPRPSREPTISPSRIPSAFPTRKPTRSPTPLPSRLPSAVPTRKPTRSPTIYPSESPTEEPTYMPSQPTSQPSSTPTTVTPRPSYRPSILPTANPSMLPTLVPTREPTIKPTIRPSVVPTARPSRSPTVAPSPEPTAEPSVRPSRAPTPQPSIVPSRAPSLAPTRVPTLEPTEMPTISFKPTPVPTRAPTIKPSLAPTRSPSTAIATTVTLALSQVLVNIDAASFANSSTNSDAFTRAVSDSIDGIQDEDVIINSVVDGDTTAARNTAGTDRRRHLRVTKFDNASPPRSALARATVTMTVPQVTIEYLIAFVMEELGYDNGTLAVRFAADSLSGAVEDGAFLESLRAAVLLLGADPALLNITSSSLTLISSSAVVLRSAAPSMQPTVPPGNEDAALYGNWPVYLKAIVPIIAALVLLAIIVVLWLWRSVWYDGVSCAWLVCVRSSNDDSVPASVPLDGLNEAAPADPLTEPAPVSTSEPTIPTPILTPPPAHRRFTLLSLFGAAPAAAAGSYAPAPSTSVNADVEQGGAPAVDRTAPVEDNTAAGNIEGGDSGTAAVNLVSNTTLQNTEGGDGAEDSQPPQPAHDTPTEITTEPATASYTVLPPVLPRTPTFLDYISSALAMVIPDGEDDQSLASERSAKVSSAQASGPSTTAGESTDESSAAAPTGTDTVNPASARLAEEQPPVSEAANGVPTGSAATTSIAPDVHIKTISAMPVPNTRAKLTFRLAAKRFSAALIHHNVNTDGSKGDEPAAPPVDAPLSQGAPSEEAAGNDDKPVTSPLKTASKRFSQLFHLPLSVANPTSAIEQKEDEDHFLYENPAAHHLPVETPSSVEHLSDELQRDGTDVDKPKKAKSSLSSAVRRLSAFVHTKHEKPANSTLDTPAPPAVTDPAVTDPEAEMVPQPPLAVAEITTGDSSVPPPAPPPEIASESTTSPTPKRASILMAEWLFGTGTAEQDVEIPNGVAENRKPFAGEPAPAAPGFDDITNESTSTAPPRSPRNTTADDASDSGGGSSPRSAGQRLPSSGAFTRPKSILKTSNSRSPSPMRGSRVVFSDSEKSEHDGSESGSAKQDTTEAATTAEVRPVAASPRRASLLDMMSAAIAMIVPDSLDEPDGDEVSEEAGSPKEVRAATPDSKEDESQISHATTAELQPLKASPQVRHMAHGTATAPIPTAPGIYDSPVKARPRASTTALDETIVINLSRNSPPRSGFNPLRFFSPSRHLHAQQSQDHSIQHTEDHAVPAPAPLPTVQLGDQDSVPVREPNVNRSRTSFSRRLSAASAGAEPTSSVPAVESSPALAMEPAPTSNNHAPWVPETPPRRQSLNAPSPEMRRMYATAPPVVNYAKRGPHQSGSSFSKP